jgi:hypothetical protein
MKHIHTNRTKERCVLYCRQDGAVAHLLCLLYFLLAADQLNGHATIIFGLELVHTHAPSFLLGPFVMR